MDLLLILSKWLSYNIFNTIKQCSIFLLASTCIKENVNSLDQDKMSSNYMSCPDYAVWHLDNILKQMRYADYNLLRYKWAVWYCRLYNLRQFTILTVCLLMRLFSFWSIIGQQIIVNSNGRMVPNVTGIVVDMT